MNEWFITTSYRVGFTFLLLSGIVLIQFIWPCGAQGGPELGPITTPAPITEQLSISGSSTHHPNQNGVTTPPPVRKLPSNQPPQSGPGQPRPPQPYRGPQEPSVRWLPIWKSSINIKPDPDLFLIPIRRARGPTSSSVAAGNADSEPEVMWIPSRRAQPGMFLIPVRKSPFDRTPEPELLGTPFRKPQTMAPPGPPPIRRPPAPPVKNASLSLPPVLQKLSGPEPGSLNASDHILDHKGVPHGRYILHGNGSIQAENATEPGPVPLPQPEPVSTTPVPLPLPEPPSTTPIPLPSPEPVSSTPAVSPAPLPSPEPGTTTPSPEQQVVKHGRFNAPRGSEPQPAPVSVSPYPPIPTSTIAPPPSTTRGPFVCPTTKIGAVNSNALADKGKAQAIGVSQMGADTTAKAINGTVAIATTMTNCGGDATSISQTYGDLGARSTALVNGTGSATGIATSLGKGSAQSNALSYTGDAKTKSVSLGAGNSTSTSISKQGGNATAIALATKGASLAQSKATEEGNSFSDAESDDDEADAVAVISNDDRKK